MKYLKWFYIVTTGFMVLGSVINIASNQFDLYQLWAVVAFLTGWYLIENK